MGVVLPGVNPLAGQHVDGWPSRNHVRRRRAQSGHAGAASGALAVASGTTGPCACGGERCPFTRRPMLALASGCSIFEQSAQAWLTTALHSTRVRVYLASQHMISMRVAASVHAGVIHLSGRVSGRRRWRDPGCRREADWAAGTVDCYVLHNVRRRGVPKHCTGVRSHTVPAVSSGCPTPLSSNWRLTRESRRGCTS